MAETSAGPQVPAVDPKNLIETALSVIKNPTEFFKGIKGETGFQKPLTFSVAMGVVSGIISAIAILLWAGIHGAVGIAIAGAVMALISGVIGGILAPFIGGVIIWVISMIFGSKAQWQASVPIAAYSYAIGPIAALSGFIPLLGIIVSLAAWIYGIYICVMGAKVINFEAPPAPAAPPQA
jgi:hypothetical protein